MSQQSNQDPEAQVRAAIKRLAEMPCPRAHEGHEGYLASDGSGLPCPDCGGTGARYPWLWRDCPRCDGDARCGLCNGRGWLINHDIRLEDVLEKLLCERELWQAISRWYGWLGDHSSGIAKRPPTKSEIRLAFFAALEKVSK